MSELLDKVRQGNARAISRLITGVENNEATAQSAAAALHPFTGNAHIIGVTGPPGCGKSTLVNEIAKTVSDRGFSVGIIAVDPSSPFTGGALLGDRVRMADIVNRKGVFVRSMASRGTLGGLAQTTSTVTKVLDAAGFDAILVETVGAGQAEVDIASVAHTVLVIEAPGSGDEVQTIKAGILEIADILVVNKADQPAALNTVRTLEAMLRLGQSSRFVELDDQHHAQISDDIQLTVEVEADKGQTWSVPVLQTIALEGVGIEALVGKIEEHHRYLRDSGAWFEREVNRSAREIERLLQNRLLVQMRERVLPEQRAYFVSAVARRELDPYTAAGQLYDLINPIQD